MTPGQQLVLEQVFEVRIMIGAPAILVLRSDPGVKPGERLEGRPQAKSCQLPSFETVTRSKLRVTSSEVGGLARSFFMESLHQSYLSPGPHGHLSLGDEVPNCG